MGFGKSIVHINDEFDHQKFPYRFSNQIYISSISKFEPYGYTSNFSIKFVAQGEELFFVNNKPKLVRSGQVLIINNGDYIEAQKQKTKNKSVGLSVFIDLDLLMEVHNSMIHPENDIPVDSGSIQSLEFYPEIISDDPAFQDYLHNVTKFHLINPHVDPLRYFELCEQLINFRERLDKRIANIKAVKKATQLEIYKRVNLARQYLYDNVNKSFSLEELSKICFMSKYFLIRNFRQIYSTTPQKFHSDLKMKRARELLTSGYSVTETAHLLGYPNIFYFSRMFKSCNGYPPKAFLH